MDCFWLPSRPSRTFASFAYTNTGSIVASDHAAGDEACGADIAAGGKGLLMAFQAIAIRFQGIPIPFQGVPIASEGVPICA